MARCSILVLADESADPRFVGADLLGQAEHSPTSPAVLVTDCDQFGHAVEDAVDTWLETWPTADVAGEAWRSRGEIVVCGDREEMATASDAYAPEHFEIQTRNDSWFEKRLRHYGSLFVGERATAADGDKAIGVNHVLPTERAARYTGGLWVGKFLRTLTYRRLEDAGTRRIAPVVAEICDAELLVGHAITARLRLERLQPEMGL